MPGYATGHTAYFQKRHYEVLTGVIRGADEYDDVNIGPLVDRLCARLAEDNPAFGAERFRKACGL